MSSDASVRFLMRAFSRHYREGKLTVPDRFSRREYGFMFFDRDFVMRHLAFSTRAGLKKYLVDQVPSHAYYSSAYYEAPSAPTMADKKWLGADLIFDLDADHVEGAKDLPYDRMLDHVKHEVVRLIDEFLLGDFGFEEDQMKIVFSGGRGYHVHVTDPRVAKLSSHERREIVDYITGTDLDMDWVFPATPFEAGRFKERIDVAHRRDMPTKAGGGWRSRIRHGVEGLLDDLEKLPEEEAKKQLKALVKGIAREIGPRTVGGLYEDLFGGRKGKRGVDRIRSENTFEVFSEKRHADAFIEIVEKRVKVRVKGETDEPVTSDIKRLIRLPSSLHGKTGFEVVQVTRDTLDTFDPFADAIPAAFGDDPVRIMCSERLDLKLRGERYSLGQGENTVPEFVAVHLVCRRLAEVGSEA